MNLVELQYFLFLAEDFVGKYRLDSRKHPIDRITDIWTCRELLAVHIDSTCRYLTERHAGSHVSAPSSSAHLQDMPQWKDIRGCQCSVAALLTYRDTHWVDSRVALNVAVCSPTGDRRYPMDRLPGSQGYANSSLLTY